MTNNVENSPEVEQIPSEVSISTPDTNSQEGHKHKKQKPNRDPTKPFLEGLPPVIKLAKISNVSFHPRKAETEEFKKLVKLKVPPKAITDSSTIDATNGAKKPSLELPNDASKTQSPQDEETNPDEKAGVSKADPVSNDETKKSDDKEVVTDKTYITETRLKPDTNIPGSKAFWKSLKSYHSNHGTRRFAQFIIPIAGPEPHVLLFTKTFRDLVVPGGYLNHDEDESDGVRRVFKEIFQTDDKKDDLSTLFDNDQLKFREVIGKWHRPEFTLNVYPYRSKYAPKSKEIIKVYLVELPSDESIKIKLGFSSHYEGIVPHSLYTLYTSENPEVKSIPTFLSRFEFA